MSIQSLTPLFAFGTKTTGFIQRVGQISGSMMSCSGRFFFDETEFIDVTVLQDECTCLYTILL